MPYIKACTASRCYELDLKGHLATAILLGLTVLVWYLIRLLRPREDESPASYSVELPSQLYADYKWDLSCLKAESKPSELIVNGLIHPTCPADGRPLSSPITPLTSSQIDATISLASTAQHTWRLTNFAQRRRVLSTLLAYINTHQEEIVKACCLDSGKTKIDACFGEILVTVEKLQWTIKHGENVLQPSERPTNLLMCYKKNTVLYEPLGVVAACVSWNYPFHNFISPVISALFTGNAIIVKPSEQTCWSTIYFTSIIRAALSACGHSPDLVQNCVCLPETADYLTSHPSIRHITFIGSRAIAHKVCTSAAKSLTPVTVELGGKDPALICDDPATVRDIDNVASILMRGVFQSAGQNCIGIERIIALPRIHDVLLEKIEPLIANLRVGSALLSEGDVDMGSLISHVSFRCLEFLIRSAVDGGAIVHSGGKRHLHPDFPNGSYFQPTLLSNVTPEMEIANTELFAPIFLLMRAESVSHAISIANGTMYGLGASVFSHHTPSIAQCKKELQCGMLSINDFGSYYAVSLPFGGVKGSGYGRFGGEEGLRSLCNIKAVCEDWGVGSSLGSLGIQTRIPGLLRYPVNGQRGWEVCKGIVETGYGVGWVDRGRGVWKLLEALIGFGKGEGKR